MKKSYLLILLSSVCLHLFAFEFSGDPKSWSKENFVGFDPVGDCESEFGDISSVFTLVENNKLFLRITFNDMYSRSMRVDNFMNQNIQAKLIIMNQGTRLFDGIFDINEILKDEQSFSFLRTPEHNLLELEIDWSAQYSR